MNKNIKFDTSKRVLKTDPMASKKDPLKYALVQVAVSHGETTFIKEFPKEYYELPACSTPPRNKAASMILGNFSDMIDRVIAINDRAEKIMLRLFGMEGRTPHSFYDPQGFINSCNEQALRKRIRYFIVLELAERMAAREGMR